MENQCNQKAFKSVYNQMFSDKDQDLKHGNKNLTSAFKNKENELIKDKISKGDFNGLNKNEQYSVLVFLIKHLLYDQQEYSFL